MKDPPYILCYKQYFIKINQLVSQSLILKILGLFLIISPVPVISLCDASLLDLLFIL